MPPLFVAALLFFWLAQPASARDRVHYIAADEVKWNYAPQHLNLIAGGPLRPLSLSQLGWFYNKAIYREYTDPSFTQLLPTRPEDRYRGLMGPAIHAEVGDTIVVVFRNRTQVPVDIVPAGLLSNPAPAPVEPGGTRTFRWPIRETDGPTVHDASSILYTYRSEVQPTADENAGLIGPLIVTRWGAARADGSPIDVDREIVLLYSVQAEARSFLVETNLRDRAVNPGRISKHAVGFADANEFPSIDGFVYGNMPIPVLRAGERVRWYLLSTQNDLDAHAPTWDGQTVLLHGNRLDSVSLVTPHLVVDMVPDDPGIWLLTCNFSVHLTNGMEARYKVVP